MSRYTTEVRFICEMNSGFPVEEMYKYSVDEIINASHDKIFSFAYPLFDPDYKATLENKILKHYYTREIAAETVNLWRTWLNATMNEIMPKYNALYAKQMELAEKLFYNIDVTTDGLTLEDLKELLLHNKAETFTSKTNEKSVTDFETDSTNKNQYSDTPQGAINFNQTDNNQIYLTDYRRIDDHAEGVTNDNLNRTTNNTDKSATDQNRTNDNKIQTKLHEYGYRGGKTFMELINDLADQFVNIDQMIINDLDILFFKLW